VARYQGATQNKLAAALLALFLGGLGIQFFYLGRAGKGVLCLLFCWTFIPAIIGFIHGLILLTMDEATFSKTYGHAKV
jgi:TM2 domain-containing membrane protein YozV